MLVAWKGSHRLATGNACTVRHGDLPALHGTWKSHQLFTVLGQAPSLAFYWMDGKGEKKSTCGDSLEKHCGHALLPMTCLNKLSSSNLWNVALIFFAQSHVLEQVSFHNLWKKKSNGSTLLFNSQAHWNDSSNFSFYTTSILQKMSFYFSQMIVNLTKFI